MNLKEIFTIVLMLEFVIINKYDEEKLLNQIKPLTINTYLNKQNFINIEFWFEAENNNYNGKLILTIQGIKSNLARLKNLFSILIKMKTYFLFFNIFRN